MNKVQERFIDELQEMTIKAIENCKTCQCNECPFKERPSYCMTVLEYLVKNRKEITKMRNCKTCAHHHYVEKIKPFPGGAECTSSSMDNVCTARIDFDDKVEWRVDVDDNEYCCDNYIPKKDKERTDPIIGG